MLYVGRTDEAITRIRQAMGVDPFFPDDFHWQMSWALWEKGDCDGAALEMQKMATIPDGAQRMYAAALSCAGQTEAARKLAIFMKTSNHELSMASASALPQFGRPPAVWIVGSSTCAPLECPNRAAAVIWSRRGDGTRQRAVRGHPER